MNAPSPLPATHLLGSLLLLVAHSVSAAGLEVRLVAADQPAAPPVSTRVDFRRAADGGLIATQWLSGVTLGGQALFPIASPSALLPKAPDVSEPAGKAKLAKEADDLLKELDPALAKGGNASTNPVDLVDALYRGQKLSLGRPVGPQRTRASVTFASPAAGELIEPGALAVPPGARRLDVPCFPLTITAVQAGRDGQPVAFTPRLTWRGRDLLAECLFEHSPDLPLGDTGERKSATLEEWLSATRGGERAFRRLTIYLPALADAKSSPYELNGHPLRLGPEGVTLTVAPANANAALRRTDKFAVELVFPAPALDDRVPVPVLTALGPGWSGPTDEVLWLRRDATILAVTVNTADGRALTLRPELPLPLAEADRWHLAVLLVGGRTPEDLPAAHVLGVPRNTAAQTDPLEFRLASAGPGGPLPLPPTLTMHVRAGYPLPPASTNFSTLAFAQAAPGLYRVPRGQLAAGPASAELLLGPGPSPAFPLALADAATLGAATLTTHHNRSDYYRGEEVQLAIIVRALKEFPATTARLTLRHESAGEFPLGELSLAAPADQPRTFFVKLPTARWQLGRHELHLAAPGLLTYAHAVTLYSATPATTFALPSWMPASFSGPPRVGSETTANLLLDQAPTKFLAPHELAAFTAQPVAPHALRAWFAHDALLPAPEKTDTYDTDTEREMAVAMRLGLRYAPGYGWGMNGQEAAWNPKHSLPEDLARMQRLCSFVAQRHRDFGNYAGLHLNWYPTAGGYWEDHPPTDGHATARAARLAAELAQLQTNSAARPGLTELDRAVQAHHYRVGALPRAYRAWTEQSSQLLPGLADTALSEDVAQPGLSPQTPVASSFLPVSWFNQSAYYPSVYFSTLPAATVHAYTDYGFSPFQHLWAVDFWAAGVGTKPRWLTSMSNGRDLMLQQALLAVGRGAAGVDLHGDDPAAAKLLARLLTAYGPWFRRLTPESDVAIVTSLRQQFADSKLVGKWMGYTGGGYFDLYTKLWYARRPPAVLLEEELTPERLRAFRAVFLVQQQTPFPAPATAALAAFSAGGRRIFKDAGSSTDLPGQVFSLAAGESLGPALDPKQYRDTRDAHFVGVQAGYEAVARSLDQLLAQLPPPRVTSDSHHTLLATLAGRELAVVMAANDTHPPPGIQHPWNFWSATLLAAEGRLAFARDCVVYDVLAGGQELRPTRGADGRFTLPVAFDRAAARPLVVLPAALRELRLTTRLTADRGMPPASGAAVPAASVLQASRLQTAASPSEMLGGLRQAGTPAPLREPTELAIGVDRPSGAAVPAASVLQASRLQPAAPPSETPGGLRQAGTPAPLREPTELAIGVDRPSGAAVPAATVLQASRLQAAASPSETLGGLRQAGTPAPLGERAELAVSVEVVDARQQVVAEALPLEIALLDAAGRSVETIYRALAPGETCRLLLPAVTREEPWRVRVRELVSGLTAEQTVRLLPAAPAALTAAPVLVPRPADVRRFLTPPAPAPARTSDEFDPLQAIALPEDAARPPKTSARVVILLDRPQAVAGGTALAELAAQFAAQLRTRGLDARVEVVDPLDIVELPLRWQLTARDRAHREAVAAGQRVASVASLATRYFPGEKKLNQPDYLHPDSGYAEPATRHRISDHVVLLGTMADNRYLADLHATAGQAATEHFPAAGGALVQVVFDAFTAGRHALSVQAPDLPGLRLGVEAALATTAFAPAAPPVPVAILAGKTSSTQRTALNLVREDTLGASVSPLAFTPDGGALASANLQANTYFQFTAGAQLTKAWLGKYGLLPAASGNVLWAHNWWGAPGQLDKLVRCDAAARPQWVMDAPRHSGSFQGWRHPGSTALPDRASDDLFLAGHGRVARVNAAGQMLWLHDDTASAGDVRAFRFRRDFMLHDVSPDGRHLLVAAFGVEPYSHFVSHFVRPALILFDAVSGKLLWAKDGVLIDHSACAFTTAGGLKILAGDATPERRRLLLLGLDGREEWSLPRAEGTSAAALTADGKRVVVRPEAARDRNHQVIGEPQGLAVIDLATQRTTAFPLTAPVAAWRLLPRSGRVLVSTADGQLTLFESDTRRVWERQFTGPASLLVAEDEQQLVVGTPDGFLRWLGPDGTPRQTADLMPHNRVTDLARYVRDYTQAPVGVPQMQPTPAPPPTIEARGRGVVNFSTNLLAAPPAIAALLARPLTTEHTLTAEPVAGRTHVLSLVQRALTDANARLLVRVTAAGRKEPLCEAELPLSATWAERTVAWPVPAGTGRLTISLRLAGTNAAGVEIQRAGLFAMKFASGNLLAQRGRADPAAAPGALLDEAQAKPPTLRYFAPNDVDLAARARGAPPFPCTLEPATPFDGRVSGQRTSWTGKPLSGSTHATLELKFAKPVKLGALAVYEDPTSAAHYADTYALLAREAKTGRAVQLGNVVGNRNPYNLFVFPAVEVESLTYLWLKSADGHARLVELEGYRAEADLLE